MYRSHYTEHTQPYHRRKPGCPLAMKHTHRDDCACSSPTLQTLGILLAGGAITTLVLLAFEAFILFVISCIVEESRGLRAIASMSVMGFNSWLVGVVAAAIWTLFDSLDSWDRAYPRQFRSPSSERNTRSYAITDEEVSGICRSDTCSDSSSCDATDAIRHFLQFDPCKV